MKLHANRARHPAGRRSRRKEDCCRAAYTEPFGPLAGHRAFRLSRRLRPPFGVGVVRTLQFRPLAHTGQMTLTPGGPERQAAHAPVGQDCEHLVHLKASRFESERGARHVQVPDARPRAPRLGNRLVPRVFQILNPPTEREWVVLAQALEMTNLEAGRLDAGDDSADLLQLAVGEDVAVHERPTRKEWPTPGRPTDAVVEKEASRAEERAQAPEVEVELREAYVLEHANRRDSVVRAVCDIPVIREADLDPIGETRLQHAFARELGLAARDGDADPRDA